MNLYKKANIFIATIKASYRFSKGGGFFGIAVDKTEGLGLNIYHNDDFVVMSTGITDLPMALVVNTTIGNSVIVNTLMLEADKRLQDTILLHEEGHINNGDLGYINSLGLYKRATFRGSSISNDFEVAADKWAVENGGSKRDLLVFLGRIKSLYGDTKELRIRRKALLSL